MTRCQREFEKDKKDDESREEQLKAIENATTVMVALINNYIIEKWLG